MLRPTVVYHADWGKDEDKRWSSKAVLDGNGRYIASVPSKVGSLDSLIPNIRNEIRDSGYAFVGFDFPIGVPAFYAQRAGISSFRHLLPRLGQNEWEDFYKVCRDASEISVYRPFYPDDKYEGRKQEELFRALGAPSMEELLRLCERGGENRRGTCSLFWTLGGKQVGKGAIVGWRDVLTPALLDDKTLSLWPFDGRLDSLLVPGAIVLAETYPARVLRMVFPLGRQKRHLKSQSGVFQSP